MDLDIINPYTDVEPLPINGFTRSAERLDNTQEFQIGFGTRVIRGDEQGLWLGAKRFTDAPFRINMDGQIFAESASGLLTIDGLNNRIVLNDGTTNRVVIGNV